MNCEEKLSLLQDQYESSCKRANELSEELKQMRDLAVQRQKQIILLSDKVDTMNDLSSVSLAVSCILSFLMCYFSMNYLQCLPSFEAVFGVFIVTWFFAVMSYYAIWRFQNAD